MDEKCIFCKIVTGELPSAKVWENDRFLAFLDINPAAKGHTLVLPKRHAPELHDLTPEEMEGLMEALAKVADGVRKSLKTDGFNIILNNGRAAGQIIFHVHFHILPRFLNDEVSFRLPRVRYEGSEMLDYARKIGEAVPRQA